MSCRVSFVCERLHESKIEKDQQQGGVQLGPNLK